jgi:hypothetical protein
MTCWDGHEKLRQKLIASAERLRDADDALPPMGNSTWFENITRTAMFDEVGAALRALIEIKRYAVQDIGLDLDLVRSVTQPILNEHPDELKMLRRNLQNRSTETIRS